MNNEQSKSTQNTNGKKFTGKVVSAKSLKTVIVAFQTVTRHPLYKKAIRRTRRIAVHNESFDLSVGDSVRIGETRPLSRTKHFIVLEKIN